MSICGKCGELLCDVCGVCPWCVGHIDQPGEAGG